MSVDAALRSREIQRALGREWVLIALVLALLAAFAGAGRWLGRLDASLYDLASGIWRRAPSSDILIVAIDEPSLAAIGRWPWPRAVHATALERIAAGHPAAIGLDLILAEPDAANPRADEALVRALERAPTVLPVYTEGLPGRLREVRPTPQIAAAAKALGHIDAEIDGDGVVRRVFLKEGLDAPTRSHFALALLDIARPGALERVPGARWHERKVPANTLVRDHRFAIPFVGPPGTVPRISYAAVLRGEVPAEAFRNRIVLVGAAATGLGDTYPTPVSGESVTMPGIEVSANVIDALLRGIDIDEATPLAQAIVVPIATVLLLGVFLLISPRAALVVAVLAVIAAALLAVVFLRVGGYWFSPALFSFCALTAYPIWSWRRLEATSRHLTLEMRRAGDELAAPFGLTDQRDTRRDRRKLEDRFGAELDAAHTASEALRRSRRVFAQSLAGLPMAVLVCDRREHLMLVNPPAAALLGVSTDMTGGMRHFLAGDVLAALEGRPDGVPGEGSPELRALLRDAIEHGAHGGREIASGGRHFLVSVAPYAQVDGIVVGAIATLVDLSEVKRLEREREEFLQFVSHDLRAPQNSIIAVAQLARDEPASFAEGQVPRLVEGYARTTLEMIDSMLAQSRAERIATESFVEVDVVSIMQDAIDQCWPLAQSREQRLDADLAQPNAFVRGNADLLVRALVNLISNASKYSPVGGTIHIGLTRGDANWRISVRDAGIGIPAASLERLFTKFYRVPRGEGPDPGGTGLGLALVRTVARKHGGEVSVESAPGGGSTFTMSLPVQDAGRGVPI